MEPVKISVLVSGSGTNLEALFQSIQQQKINARVVQVISNRPEAYGLVRARNRGIPARHLSFAGDAGEDVVAENLLHWLQEAETQLVVLAGFLKKIPTRVIEAYPNKMMNIHPSLIPAFAGPGWYGMKIHEAVWRRGVKITGATVHLVNEEMDGGPIVLQEAVPLDDDDQPKDIQQKVLEVEHRLLPEAVALFAEGKLQVETYRVRIRK